MTYSVKFTDTTDPAKPSITVEDQSLNQETNLKFVGKNYTNYGEVLAENFLHLLENFARSTPPGTNVLEGTPVQGQLWYDNTDGINLLKVYDGTTWSPTGSIRKASSAPPILSSTSGDVWIDTNKNQLYISSGSTWLLVGPQYSAGAKTGPEIETITDTNNVDHTVTTIYSENFRIAIISKSAFTPKTTIAGFLSINQGVNLSSVDVTSTSSPTKFWGRASEADALYVSGTTVKATNFLRSDITSTTNNPFNIRSNDGITIGADLSFNISTNDTSTIFYSKNRDKSINFKVNNQDTSDPELNPGEYVALSIRSNTKVGIGPNNVNPTATLDVAGDVRTSKKVKIQSTEDATTLGDGTCSLSTEGGFSVDKSSFFGNAITSYGPIYVNRLTGYPTDPASGTPVVSAVAITPGSTAATELYDIGQSDRKFRNIYAKNFVGNVTGDLYGNIYGNIYGTATSLQTSIKFRMQGDVTTSEDLPFTGQSEDGYATLNTVIGTDLINGKPQVYDAYDSDLLLIYRGGNIGSGLKKITKATFVSNLPVVPVGAIFPFAGPVTSSISPPPGYLLCDGSEIKISKYQELFQVIGYTYKASSSLIGQASFALPDLRGRFALGMDNMDNGLSIPDKNAPAILLDAGGGSANRVTSVVADTLGAGSGAEQVTIGVTNLPEHKHNLKSDAAQYFAVGVPGATDPDSIPSRGLSTGSIDGSGLPNSGGVDSGTLGQPINAMNPYLSINYIIFTGVFE